MLARAIDVLLTDAYSVKADALAAGIADSQVRCSPL